MNALRAHINKQVPIERFLRVNGFKVDERGFMSCPFHEDKTPSLKVYGGERGWCCFSCRRGGRVSEFLGYLKGIPHDKAAERIAKRLKLGKPRITVERPERQNLNPIVDQWERSVCSCVHRTLQGVTHDGLKLALYGAWYSGGFHILDRARYLVNEMRYFGPLSQAQVEVSRLLQGATDAYVVHRSLRRNRRR